MDNGSLWLSVVILVTNGKNVTEKKDKQKSRAKRRRENPVDTTVDTLNSLIQVCQMNLPLACLFNGHTHFLFGLNCFKVD